MSEHDNIQAAIDAGIKLGAEARVIESGALPLAICPPGFGISLMERLVAARDERGSPE